MANLNALVLDFVARSKAHNPSVNWYIAEQLPIVPLMKSGNVRFGFRSAAQIVPAADLELTYTSHDMTPFAKDMGYADAAGTVKSPFNWDQERRVALRAKLDAAFFHLYGISDRDDVRYIHSTFPIVELTEMMKYSGVYRSYEFCLAYMNALAAGEPDVEIVL